MYIVKCYLHENDKSDCLRMAYERKAAAKKRADKALKTFEKVTIEYYEGGQTE